jgi:hypothetical protein
MSFTTVHLPLQRSPFASVRKPISFTVEDPTRIKQAVKSLVPFWTGVLIGGVTKGACQHYQKTRERAVATVRRELTTLRVAINYAHAKIF